MHVFVCVGEGVKAAERQCAVRRAEGGPAAGSRRTYKKIDAGGGLAAALDLLQAELDRLVQVAGGVGDAPLQRREAHVQVAHAGVLAHPRQALKEQVVPLQLKVWVGVEACVVCGKVCGVCEDGV